MGLNKDQKLIMACLNEGLTNIEIGEKLGYSPDTIKKKLKLLYKKFNARGRTDLVAKYTKGNTMKTTVIFDLDGTLLYTLEDLTDSVNYALQKFQLENISIEKVRSYVGNGVKKLIERAVGEKLNEKQTTQCLEIFKTHYKTNMYNKTKPYDGILNLLDKLHDNNINVAVVSNKFDKAVKELCKFYFNEKIDIAIGERDTINKKPSTDGVYAAINEFNETVKNCVYVGDSEVDILTAKNAGMDCISVSWGYKDKEFLIKNGADCIVSDWSELYEQIVK